MREVLDLGYSLYIAMIKTGECSFDVRQERVCISDWFRRQTEKFISVSAAAAKNVFYIAYYIAKYLGWTTFIVAAGSPFFSPS